MELRHLRYFLAVAETENVRAASEQLHVTQPAISRQVQDLEEELGAQLFDRLSRGLRLNENGRTFQKDIAALLRNLDLACERVRRTARGEAGSLRIGFIEVAGWEGIIPDSIRSYRAQVPDVHLEPIPFGSPEQLRRILDGSLDGGFAYLFGNCPSGIANIPLQRHGVALAISKGTHFAGRTVRLQDLHNEKFVSFCRAAYPSYFDALLVACSAGGLVPQIVQQVQNEAAVLSLVTSGIGLAIVNDRNRFRAPAQVEFAHISDLDISLPLHFVYKQPIENPAIKPLIEILHSTRQPADAASTALSAPASRH